ncbi:Chlorophyll a-b binding protein 6, chloroplastic [Gracilariopsis chorda]|uniref:Chlorophyll a-b binding protein 6, chloroplastic n=1 Tax=Gracilariopsis chorda TaxID=448386 RepID=A0A2V3J5P9_9FLOR|nr:Chlorophyll a-b binding protein 6, chloroplastic [Gracilariopsis chorda]|eukprot:PXF49735.1 Chlorophyll a-b binding protein 6, chloroplastic [Gracilariopsis chorda]
MFAFVAPAVTGFSASLRGKAVCNAPRVSRSAVSMKVSPSMPFMEQPATLDDGSIVGNVGFDPLNLSQVFDLKFMQEAEIKHCRVAMLAVLGYVVPEFFLFPWGKTLNPIEAHDFFVKTGGMSQILLFVSFFEVFGTLALIRTLQGERAPGYFGFDPLGLGKDPEKFKRYHLSELKNGRLAMCAFGGFYHATLLTNQGVFEQLSNFKALPGHLY